MPELFVLALLGHLAGDYLFQPKRMALAKSARTWEGFGWCTLHVAIYTACVCCLWRSANPVVWLAVYLPHWFIDRYSLASLWLKLIRGRTFEAAARSSDPHREFDVAFTALVYTVVDNTLHLFCLWGVIELLLRGTSTPWPTS
jgi:hypothetical protein